MFLVKYKICQGVLMLENDLEQEIVDLYSANLVDLLSINEISKRLNKKYPYINKKVNQLIERRILNKIVVGRSYLCSLNLENEKTMLLLALCQINKKKEDFEFLRKYVIQNSLDLTVHSVVSYQDGIIFIVNGLRERRKIIEDHPHAQALHKSEFVDMLIDTPHLFHNHIVVYGYERFFELVASAKEELKIKYSPLKY